MTGNIAIGFVAGGAPAPITIPSNWGVQGGGASPQTSVAKTLTVPAGNPGNIVLHITLAPVGTIGWIKNGGANNVFSVDTTVNFVNTDTLAFRLTGPGDSCNLTATDQATGISVGTCNISTL